MSKKRIEGHWKKETNYSSCQHGKIISQCPADIRWNKRRDFGCHSPSSAHRNEAKFNWGVVSVAETRTGFISEPEKRIVFYFYFDWAARGSIARRAALQSADIVWSKIRAFQMCGVDHTKLWAAVSDSKKQTFYDMSITVMSLITINRFLALYISLSGLPFSVLMTQSTTMIVWPNFTLSNNRHPFEALPRNTRVGQSGRQAVGRITEL